MALQCVVFDCDGVLIDSVPVKTRAFGRLAEPYGEDARERFVQYHLEHGGVSRFKKFAWFFDNIIGRTITEQESQEWGERFAALSLDEVRRCDLITGAEDVLHTWHGRIPLYVCSGAPGAEQTAVLQEKGLAQYFKAICGAPPAKTELLGQILQYWGHNPAQTLMVGDATTDRDAATLVGTLFYGVGNSLKADGEQGNFAWGPDLTGLSAFIAAHFS